VDEYVERLSAVTPAQIRAVAEKHLTDDNRTVAVLDPQPLDADDGGALATAPGGFDRVH
jgi:zinc protease